MPVFDKSNGLINNNMIPLATTFRGILRDQEWALL